MIHDDLTVENKIELEYYFPPFYRRVLANVLDAILFVFAFFGLFIGVRGIITSTPEYKAKINALVDLKIESCLYIPVPTSENGLNFINNIISYLQDDDKFPPASPTEIIDVVSVLNDSGNFGDQSKINGAEAAIKGFLTYCEEVCSEADYANILTDYESFMLSDELTNESGIHYFVKDEEEKIIINPEDPAPRKILYYTEGLAPYLDDHAQGFLITAVPGYYDFTRYLNNMLWIEIPVAYSIAGLFVYLLPLFIFRRGRMTFGKALYRIGLVDSNYFSPRFGRTMARFAIFYFGVLLLSILTLGIPLFVSFSLMAFSKKRQGFADYMLGLIEVDGYRTKIFMSRDEIILKGINTHSKAPDFKVREKL